MKKSNLIFEILREKKGKISFWFLNFYDEREKQEKWCNAWKLWIKTMNACKNAYECQDEHQEHYEDHDEHQEHIFEKFLMQRKHARHQN